MHLYLQNIAVFRGLYNRDLLQAEEVPTQIVYLGGGLVSEHDAGTYTMVYHNKGTCISSPTNRPTQEE